MRDIMFRGKAANREKGRSYRTSYKNGDWVYGLLTNTENYAGFAEMTNTDGVCGIEVDKSTVGQFTGLTDRNGTNIFEGDILACSDYGERLYYSVVRYGEFNCSCCNGVYGWYFDGYGDIRDFDPKCSSGRYWIVGNIHDNPELLEVTDDA